MVIPVFPSLTTGHTVTIAHNLCDKKSDIKREVNGLRDSHIGEIKGPLY